MYSLLTVFPLFSSRCLWLRCTDMDPVYGMPVLCGTLFSTELYIETSLLAVVTGFGIEDMRE